VIDNATRNAELSMPEAIRRLPDFIIGGAPRSGTSWLYALARRHPQIAMSEPMTPEPKFFLVDELWQLGIDYYSEKWFDPLPAGRVLGEKSSNYLESPEAAGRIYRALPGVKLVFLLRNPVDRAYSNYLWSRQNGLETETFERALALEEQRERDLAAHLRYARPHAYFSRGLYAKHLMRFYDRFPQEEILVLRFEDVRSRPEDIAAAFHRFLGVTEMPALARGAGRVNAARCSRSEPLSPLLRRRLIERYSAANFRLAALLGPDFEIWDDD
jgi:Sulfotransferase domain